MRIAILEYHADQKSGTGVRGRAIRDYLVSKGHAVEVVAPNPERFEKFNRARYGLVPRLIRKVTRRATLPHTWDWLADEFESEIRRGGYDAVIARGQDVGYVLTRPLECVKILDMANVLFLEAYYTWGPNLDEVEETYEKEIAVCAAVDHILSPHDLFTEYCRTQFDALGRHAGKMVTVRLGGYPSPRVARYAEQPRMVYAGAYYYIQDPVLLATLTKLSPYPIDCYGPKDPNRSFLPARLGYKGYAPDTGFLADYQLGVITVSRDLLRQYSPSTKFAYYFAAGLPVLFPEWMKEGYEYPDSAIPFAEGTFSDVARRALERDRWEAMHRAALEHGRRLAWDVVLGPLDGLLG
jgi:hypothetical protein